MTVHPRVRGEHSTEHLQDQRRELEALGLPPEAVEAALQHEAQQQPIEVLECNWIILQVFLRCEPTLSVGAASAVYTGMPAAEIVEVMGLLSVPKPERVETFDGVRQMARVWCETRNAARATA